MSPEEVTAISDFLNAGGTLFIARDAVDSEGRARAEDDNLNAMLLDNWGVTLRRDLIIEQVLAQAGQTFGLSFIGANYGNSPIIGSDLERFGTIFNVARSVATQDVEGVTKINLITTSDQAWGETNFDALSAGSAEPNPGEDAQGPLTIGVSAENSESEARLVVFGDTDFISNALVVSGGNGLLVTNAFNWLANDELAVELTPRETVNRQVIISQTQLGLLQVMSICLGPGLMALVGAGVWYSRRRNR
jgi:ABC-type uncharacterized transport system involved in gliding motility auxiliary subunit